MPQSCEAQVIRLLRELREHCSLQSSAPALDERFIAAQNAEAAAGLVNVGQLTRERHGHDDVVLVGFGTHRGGVIASDRWVGPVQRMPVPPARPGSVEALLHEATDGTDTAFVFPRNHTRERDGWLHSVLDHRAIGVVYHPQVERRGNYVPTVLGRRYDAFLYCDLTTALRPLHPLEQPDVELETYPIGY